MYKTILVHVDHSARSARRSEVAAALALDYDAHLVGAAMTGLPAFLLAPGAVRAGATVAGLPVAALRAEANRALDLFEANARAAGAPAIERRCIDDEPGMGMSMQGRYCDLLVISQSASDEFAPRLRSDFPDYVVLNAVRPVLVLPVAWTGNSVGRRITVAWNASPEAVRAIVSALPMLRRASQVDLVLFDPAGEGELHGAEPGADIALYLARHGVAVEVTVQQAGADEGAALRAFGAARNADLIVMGAYGRSRLREIVLGGMTRSMLADSAIPLWMAH
ncbi:universal stress protein [Massilia atriviolacea]|uniref:Universal stress protein n=1 Tax=Massilia atriviolacea TaxID=2495579 RepID=A0A430HFT6_9BURK|nr:universal stress protein [Massilia atriviolacea]RSZ56375.1 universal stress protein [Massilia atriviolacea]